MGKIEELNQIEADQQEIFEQVIEAVGSEPLAVFICCLLYDTPYILDAIPREVGGDRWIIYKNNIRQKRINKNRLTTFAESDTDVLNIYGKVDADEFRGMIQSDMEKIQHKGTSTQMEIWGVGTAARPLEKKDYDRLDYFYDTLTSRLVSGGGVDNQQELILRKVANLYWDEERLRTEGEYGEAQKCVKMALDLLSSEQLQKKDAKPVEDVRLDSIIDALEKWGAVENGKILSFPELTEFLLKELGRLGGKPAHKFTQTLDAADYELLFIQNCMAQNEDLPRWMSLPDNMRFSEEVANEFAEEQSDDEKRAYEGIGIVKTRPEKNANKKRR